MVGFMAEIIGVFCWSLGDRMSEASLEKEEGGCSSRTIRTGFRSFRTIPISARPFTGLLIFMVLKPTKPILVLLGVVLVVLELVLI